MTRWVLAEAARWIRAIGPPLVVLMAAVVAPTLVPDVVGTRLQSTPDRALLIAWLTALAAAGVWLAIASLCAAFQPAQGARAAERLQALRDRSTLPDHALVCVLEVNWTSPACQRIAAVIAQTGEVRELWLAERAFEPGTFALLVGTSDGHRLVDHLEAHEVATARRHEHISEARRYRQVDRAARRAHRFEGKAAHEVVRAAEELLG